MVNIVLPSAMFASRLQNVSATVLKLPINDINELKIEMMNTLDWVNMINNVWVINELVTMSYKCDESWG